MWEKKTPLQTLVHFFAIAYTWLFVLFIAFGGLVAAIFDFSEGFFWLLMGVSFSGLILVLVLDGWVNGSLTWRAQEEDKFDVRGGLLIALVILAYCCWGAYNCGFFG